MSPKTGRPPKDVTKSVNIGLRITEETSEKLKFCADNLQISRTEVIEKGIDIIYDGIKK